MAFLAVHFRNPGSRSTLPNECHCEESDDEAIDENRDGLSPIGKIMAESLPSSLPRFFFLPAPPRARGASTSVTRKDRRVMPHCIICER